MAVAHMQMDVHALDTRAMASGVKSSRLMYGAAFLITASEQGLPLVHVRAQVEQLQDTFIRYFGLYGGQRGSR
jgi:hypothetical protein